MKAKNFIAGFLLLWTVTIAAHAQSDWTYLTDGNHDRATVTLTPPNVLGVLPVGANYLRIIAPDVLELVRITDGINDNGTWNFASGGTYSPPDQSTGSAQRMTLFIDGTDHTSDLATSGSPATVVPGYKRRGYFGPRENKNDRRVENSLYLKLSTPIADGAFVELRNDGHGLWPSTMVFQAIKSPVRYCPAIHVNVEGYQSGEIVSGTKYPKKAKIGYYYGNLQVVASDPGEMDVSPWLTGGKTIQLLDASSGLPVSGVQFTVSKTPTLGNAPEGPQYQNVLEVDFTSFDQPGEYLLQLQDLGVSFPFRIDDGYLIKMARTYAHGVYEKRCGTAIGLPFSRFTRDACHLDTPVLPVPQANFGSAWHYIGLPDYGGTPNPAQTAPALTSESAMVFPFSGTAPSGIIGGHHDAGDYSRYTIGSALLIHNLIFAADNFTGAGALNNLGIPESGNVLNGRAVGDLYDEAKWEADFLVKMQDTGTLNGNTDGGFYTLTYPATEQFDGGGTVTPDNSDPAHIVWPKTTSVTAAAVAALADVGSSPTFCTCFGLNRNDWSGNPYLRAAKLGWQFLMRAFDRTDYPWAPGASGKDNSYQKGYYYGDNFTHNDELAWAAAAMFAAGYSDSYQDSNGNKVHDPEYLLSLWYPDPTSVGPVPFSGTCGAGSDNGPCWTYRFGWWRMFEGYGNAVRDFAFAARSGRRPVTDFDSQTFAARSAYMEKCETALTDWGGVVREWTGYNAYGAPFDSAGYSAFQPNFFFTADWAFNIAVADCVWKPGDAQYSSVAHANYVSALIENLNYECGRNPNNVSFLTGLGWKRQRAIVDQYSWNDRRVLPPTGITVGALEYFYDYPDQQMNLFYFPRNADQNASSFALYDRWADASCPGTESVCNQMARGVAVAAYLAAQTSKASQPWGPTEMNAMAASVTFTPSTPKLNTFSTAHFSAKTDLSDARIVMESDGMQPRFAATATVGGRTSVGEGWTEVEATLPDGRRLFASQTYSVNDPNNGGDPITDAMIDADTVALYHFDGDYTDRTSNHNDLMPAGSHTAFSPYAAWMKVPSGYSLRFRNLGDQVTATIPGTAFYQNNQAKTVTVDFWIYLRKFIAANDGFANIMVLYKNNNAYLAIQDPYPGSNPTTPFLGASGSFLVSNITSAFTPNTWQHVTLSIEANGNALFKVGTTTVYSGTVSSHSITDSGNWTLTIGNIDADIDEFRISSTTR